MTASLLEPARAGGALRLSDWGLIRARGDDAASFLHGQLTQDIEHLGAAEARPAGYCSAKGRLLASFIAWRPEPGTVMLACSADVLPNTLKRLRMFVLRAKCQLDDAADLALYGLAGASVQAWLGADLPSAPWQVSLRGEARVIRLPDVDGVPRALLVASAEAAPPDLPALDADVWRWLETRSGVARVVAATVEQFVPQMVNLELVGGVNFKKGCYPGQEVVARSQYRGTLKRRAFLFDTDAAAAPGQEVFHSADPGQPAGMVANAAASTVLVELKLAALEGGTLHLGAPDGPQLHPVALPYTVPRDNA